MKERLSNLKDSARERASNATSWTSEKASTVGNWTTDKLSHGTEFADEKLESIHQTTPVQVTEEKVVNLKDSIKDKLHRSN